MNSKQFGRWAEACVARYLRDKGLTVMTQEAWNMTPYVDFTATKDVGTQDEKTFHIQVKGTTRNWEGINFHYSALNRYLGYAQSRPDGQQFLFAVVSLPRQMGYFFDAEYLEEICTEASRRNGDNFSMPGIQRLMPEHAVASFSLAKTEVAEGETIANTSGGSMAAREPLFE